MTFSRAIGLFLLVALSVGGVWMYFKGLRISRDPAKIVAKTGGSLVILCVGGYFIGQMMLAGGYVAAFGGIPGAAVVGVILAIIWSGDIAELIARPFENLFTGGSRPPDPEPFYSIARAKRQHHQFDEAIELIEEQLEQFPDDFTGLMLMAEIQAVNQHNITGAAATIDRICVAHGDNPGRVMGALSALADWQLHIGRNREAALEAFQRVCNRYPNQPVANEAMQRIAHLPSQELLDQKDAPRTIELKQMPKVVIRNRSDVHVEIKQETPDEAIGRLVNHLEIHPQDRASREELAGLYATHLRDASLAIEQLGFLVRQPGQDRKHVVKWLNLIADYHLQIAGDLPAAEQALASIEQRFPKSPAAEMAMRRRATLVRELKGNEKSREVKLGSYDSDMGLR